MITKDWLDRVLPPGPALSAAVELEIGPCLASEVLGIGLRWLQDQTETDRFPRPKWKEWNPETGASSETAWSVTMDGLCYKSESQYLTAEGWPLGTQCWYVRIECGWREYVAAETPEVAVQRAIVVMAAARRWRDTDPKARQRNPMSAVEDELAAHSTLTAPKA